VLPVAATANTGDGIRMAQDIGAALWHMWHYHGAYGFRYPDANIPCRCVSSEIISIAGDGPIGFTRLDPDAFLFRAGTAR